MSGRGELASAGSGRRRRGIEGNGKMAAGAVVMVDPSELEVAANVRREVELTKEFVGSVKQHGVLVPIIVQEGLTGWAVVDGQRRTLAAVEAGVGSVPVVVIDAIEKPQDRIVQQLVVNDHRTALSQADEVAAVHELALFGMSAAAIAKKTGTTKASVEVAMKVGASAIASTVMRSHQVDFESAALIAEFDGDDEAQAALIEKAGQGWGLTHVAQEWRDRRASDRIAAEIDAAEGVTLIERPTHGQGDPLRIDELFTDAELKSRVGDLPHDDLVALAGDGLCGYPAATGYGADREWVVGYAIAGWKARGLFTYSWNESGAKKVLTPEEAEAQKAERRQARENTKAWVAATAVRIEFLKGLLQRKTMPKGWEALVARHLLVQYNGPASGQWQIASTVLQVAQVEGDYSHRQPIDRLLESNPTKAAQVSFAVALGGIEGATEFDRKGWSYDSAKPYLARLREWGYELSDVEQLVLAEGAEANGPA